MNFIITNKPELCLYRENFKIYEMNGLLISAASYVDAYCAGHDFNYGDWGIVNGYALYNPESRISIRYIGGYAHEYNVSRLTRTKEGVFAQKVAGVWRFV